LVECTTQLLKAVDVSAKFIQFKSQTKNPSLPQVFDISPEELREQLQTVQIIDVRRPDEWVGEYGHIATATLLTLDTLPIRINELSPEQTVVFVCRSGARSAQAAAFALENGFKSVYNMRGGMIEWTKKNFEVTERNGG
jgi:rhodanese-related sulfurtransferase